jgi:hypothetical protein
MFARRQLSRPQYLAAKAYAESPGKLDAIIVQATGLDGVQLVATVIGGTPLKETASAFGDSSRAAASVGWLLRRSLNALAARLGYSR